MLSFYCIYFKSLRWLQVVATQLAVASASTSSQKKRTADEVDWRNVQFLAAHPKKPRANALALLAQSMNRVADALCPIPPPVPDIPPPTPRRKRAWAVVVAEEVDLPTDQIAKVQRIWRNNPELAEEYTSFPPRLRAARDVWLQNELSLLD